MIRPFILLMVIVFLSYSCTKTNEIVDKGEGVQIEFLEGLNDDSRFQLEKDINGLYHLRLDGEGQTNWRLSARLTRNGEPGFYHPDDGYKHRLEWSSSLYWWFMAGDTVANITERYFNEFTGEYQYVNLPPLINYQDALVPTINPTGITDENTGIGNTVIGPIQEMQGDTMIVTVSYSFRAYRKEEGSSFYEPLDEVRTVTDQVKIVLD